MIEALMNCAPDDQLPFLEWLIEGLVEALGPGAPLPPFGHVMAEANSLADIASRAERKAYCAACFVRLSAGEQAAFLAFAERRMAA